MANGTSVHRCTSRTTYHAQIGGSRLVVVPGTAHGINVEAPEEFNAAVREFLSGL
jgi:pimeloyl-ACP methyl ester carboxylesterase